MSEQLFVDDEGPGPGPETVEVEAAFVTPDAAVVAELGLSSGVGVDSEAAQGALLDELAEAVGGKRRAGHKALKALWRAEVVPAAAAAVLERLARSTPAGRPTMDLLAAEAALLLWTHEVADEGIAHVEGIEGLLMAHAIPDEPRWLHATLKAMASAPAPTRGALELARQQHEARYHHTAALIGGLELVRRHRRWRSGSAQPHLLAVCDRIAQQVPRSEAPLIQLMADATVEGWLDHEWLEHVMVAAIRLSHDDMARQERLRAYHQQGRYEVDAARLAKIHAAQLSASRSRGSRARGVDAAARQDLLYTARRMATTNPRRAQLLLEMSLTSHMLNKRKPAQEPLRRTLGRLAEDDALDPTDEEVRTLLALYVRNHELDPRAVRFVRANRAWLREAPDLLRPEELEVYLLLGDYERAFVHLTCKFEGVTLTHADKHAAARVRYFVEQRVAPGQVTDMVQTAFAPLERLGQSVANLGAVQRVVAQGLKVFEARTQRLDLRERAVEDLRQLAPQLDGFDGIQRLSVDVIEQTMRSRRSQRMILGAVAGGVSGGLAPLGWGTASLADVPVVLALAADICSRFCWYYGFDPREHPELPTEILAVALGGSRPAAIQPMLLRQNWRELVFGKSLLVGALASGTVTGLVRQTAARRIQASAEAHLGPRVAEQARALVQRVISQNLRQRAAERIGARAAKQQTTRAVPWLGVAFGAALNAALLYDLCEAAQVVLTDRFLERKYPEWLRQLDLEHTPSAPHPPPEAHEPHDALATPS